MSAPNAPVRPTPENLNPRETVCLQIEVPNDRQWIAAFYDAVEQLSYWYAWDRDDAHTGRDIAARWWKVFLSIRKCNPEQPMDGCCDGSEDTLIRQNPDNPCLLESSADGIHWCTLFDQSLCTPANGQPGSGSEQPAAGGGQQCYHADFPSTMQWNLPTVVNAGDTIEVKNTGGSATDAPNHAWYCPNGQLFFAGACVSVPFTQGGDPAAAANHMTIICQIAGVWYSCDGLVTVPGGVTNAPVVFQVNDGTLSDNSGGYSFDVCVTNNASTTWEHTFPFTTDPNGWVGLSGTPWTPGTGWTPVCIHATDYYWAILAEIDWTPSTELTNFQINPYTKVPGTYFDTGVNDSLELFYGGAWHAVSSGSTPGGKVADWIGDETGVSKARFTISVANNANAHGACDAGGSGAVGSIIFKGKGTNPFAL